MEPSNTVMILKKHNSNVFKRTLHYSLTLGSKTVGEQKEGLMLLPLYVKKFVPISFEDVTENESIGEEIDCECEKINFLYQNNDIEYDSVDSCNIVKYDVGRFKLSLFEAVEDNIKVIEREYGDVDNPYFSMLGDEELFPVYDKDGIWVYVLAKFRFDNQIKRYILSVHYELPTSGLDYVPTIHERGHMKHDYDAVVITNIPMNMSTLINQTLPAFVSPPNDLKFHRKDDLGDEYYYFGYCDDRQFYKELNYIPHPVIYQSLKNNNNIVNGMQIKPLLIWVKRNNKIWQNKPHKFYLCGKQEANRMLCLGQLNISPWAI